MGISVILDWSRITGHRATDVLFLLRAYHWVGAKAWNRVILIVDATGLDEVSCAFISGQS